MLDNDCTWTNSVAFPNRWTRTDRTTDYWCEVEHTPGGTYTAVVTLTVSEETEPDSWDDLGGRTTSEIQVGKASFDTLADAQKWAVALVDDTIHS